MSVMLRMDFDNTGLVECAALSSVKLDPLNGGKPIPLTDEALAEAFGEGARVQISAVADFVDAYAAQDTWAKFYEGTLHRGEIFIDGIGVLRAVFQVQRYHNDDGEAESIILNVANGLTFYRA